MTDKTTKSLTDHQRLAKDAIQIQDACNLRGVLLAWHKAICDQSVARGGQVEEFLNVLYLSKISSLMNAQTDAIGGVEIPGFDDDRGHPTTRTSFYMAYNWAMSLQEDGK